MPEHHHSHAHHCGQGQHAYPHPHKDSTKAAHKYKYRFLHESTVHKDFKHARRHVLKNATPGHHGSSTPNAHTLSNEDEKLLRLGLSKIDMDYRWEGNLSDSQANKAANEVVVRLYRTWTSNLIYEARYRPAGSDNKLTMYEFAWEGDKEIYNGTNELDYEITQYMQILQGPILKVIKDKLKEK